MSDLSGAIVALVVLVDLATGQGPPIFTGYDRPPAYYGPPMALHPGPYMHREEHESKKDKDEYGKLDKEEHGKFDKDEKKFEKEFKKDSEKDSKKDDYDKYGEEGTTVAPGVMSSFSNSMSDVWSKYKQ